MGFLDRFSKDGRDQRTREKNAARAINKYMQSPDRMKALQALRDDGTTESLYALMRRFGMMYDKTIEDEQEKEWVFEMLVEKGATVLPALKKYMFSADSISWPLRLLDKVVDGKEGRIDVIAEVLERHEPGYERDPTKKIQLLTHLAGLKHARVPPLVAPYLADMDEGVRYAAVEALMKQADEGVARAPLLDLFAKEESLRLRIRIADGFAEVGWSVADRRADVEKALPDTFQIDAKGADARIKRKPGAKE
jgi:HEAT repeat protein